MLTKSGIRVCQCPACLAFIGIKERPAFPWWSIAMAITVASFVAVSVSPHHLAASIWAVLVGMAFVVRGVVRLGAWIADRYELPSRELFLLIFAIVAVVLFAAACTAILVHGATLADEASQSG